MYNYIYSITLVFHTIHAFIYLGICENTSIYIMNKNYIYLLVLILIVIITQYIYYDKVDVSDKRYTLEQDGCCIIKQVLNQDEINNMKQLSDKNDYQEIKRSLLNNSKLRQLISVNTKNQDYIFQDYIWIIKKSAVHTCHRDNNGDFFNEGQKYPSYTMLVYIEDMDKCLGVVPESHKDINSFNYNFGDPTINLPCRKGDVILFNANLIHVGTINDKADNLRIQLKVSHKDDIDKLKYYQNFNKILNEDNTVPDVIRRIQKKGSCILPVLSNLTQSENIRTARGSVNGANIGWGQQLFSYFFYGKSNFYDLPNAF
jgi:hypothetical protein